MELSKNDCFSIEEILFYFFFGIMLAVKGLGFYQGQKVYTLALIVSAVFIIAKLVLGEYSIYEWITIILLMGLACFIYRSSGEIGQFIIFATIIGMKNVSVKRVMAIGTVIWAVTMTVSMLLVLLGIKEDIIRAQEKLGLSHILRYSLGSTHPNVLQISAMLLCAFLIYTFRPQGKKLYLVSALMLGFNVYIFVYSVSYTGFALAVLFLIVNIYVNKRKQFSMFEKGLFYMLVPLSALFMVVGANVMPSPYFEIINKLLNTRYYITREYMGANPISLFGTGYCDALAPSLNNLDSSYVYALMHYGVIFFVLMIIGFIGLIRYLIINDKRIELGITLSLSIAAISEPFFVNTSFKNICWIFMGEFLFYELGKIAPTKTNKTSKIGSRIIKLPVETCFTRLRNICERGRRSRIISAVVAIVTGIIIAFIASFFVTKTEAYYINRTMVQIEDEAYLTIDINNLPAGDENAVIINYVDANTPMQRFDKDIVWVEYYRKLLSIAVWSAFIIYMMLRCFGGMVYSREKSD